MQLNSDRPLTSIYSPTHDVEIKRPDPNHAVIGYEAKDVRPDTDFQLFFAPQKQDVSLDLLTYRDRRRRRLLPAARLARRESEGASSAEGCHVRARYIGLHGRRQQAGAGEEGAQFCLANLNADDRFEIVRFSTEPE